ncbi:MAG: 2-C-methyl-D-erythritol 4-phosphate cytidylyltransferase [Treponema sp.]|nr:2-C-methyl-D-erythritol 4-phosphate cytidylyltransferase [Treponema sp.]
MMIPSNSAGSTGNKKIAIIITAAGSSTRMGQSVKKEYLPLGGGTVLSSCVKAFEDAAKNKEHPFEISHLIITVPMNGVAEASEAVTAFFDFDDDMKEKVEYVQGGYTRQKSVLNALEHIKKAAVQPDYVLIHDGARPFVSDRIIHHVLLAAQEFEAAAPGIPPTDTIKGIDESGFIVQHLERKMLTAIQTPQGFVFGKLFDAHKKAASDGHDYTDDTEIWGRYCGNVKLVTGDPKNIKITYPGDLEKAQMQANG